MKTISIKLFLLFVIVISCKSNKTLSGNSNIKEQAIETCLNDFIKSEKLESNTVYEIIKNNESKNLYCFWILITKNKLFVQERYKIGAKDDYFPTRFKEVKNSLFIWNDSTETIKKKIINKLNKYNFIDSTVYKIEKGLLSDKFTPIISNKSYGTPVSYYVCKNNILKFIKSKSNKILPVNKYPEVDCK